MFRIDEGYRLPHILKSYIGPSSELLRKYIELSLDREITDEEWKHIQDNYSEYISEKGYNQYKRR